MRISLMPHCMQSPEQSLAGFIEAQKIANSTGSVCGITNRWFLSSLESEDIIRMHYSCDWKPADFSMAKTRRTNTKTRRTNTAHPFSPIQTKQGFCRGRGWRTVRKSRCFPRFTAPLQVFRYFYLFINCNQYSVNFCPVCSAAMQCDLENCFRPDPVNKCRCFAV